MDEMACVQGSSVDLSQSLSVKLTRQRQRLEAQLADIQQAEAILDKNPKMKELFDIVTR